MSITYNKLGKTSQKNPNFPLLCPQGTGIWTVADAIEQNQKKKEQKCLYVNDLRTHNTQNWLIIQNFPF